MESEFKSDILDYLSLSLPSTLDESWFSSFFLKFYCFTLSLSLKVKEPLSDRNSWEPLGPILRPTLSSFFGGILKSLYLLVKLSLLELDETWLSYLTLKFYVFPLTFGLYAKEPLSDRNSWDPLLPILRPTLYSFFYGILKSLYLLSKLSLPELHSYYFVSEILSPPSNNQLPDNERWRFLFIFIL